MCLALYMASSVPCPTIPWDDDAPAFHVEANDPGAEAACHHFSKPHVYYLGSHEGCGCGFRREDHDLVDEPEEAEQRRENHRRLRDYVAKCLQHQDSIELYACWMDEEDERCEYRREVSVNQLAADDFLFEQRELTKVVRL